MHLWNFKQEELIPLAENNLKKKQNKQSLIKNVDIYKSLI